MPIPKSWPMRKPILAFLSRFPPDREVDVAEIAEHVSQHFRLTAAELAEAANNRPSDRTTRFRRNFGGAMSGLKQGRLIERTCKQHYRLTQKGRSELNEGTAEPSRSLDPKKHKSALYRNQKGMCILCRGTFDYEQMEVDHIKPRVTGGTDDFDNLQLLCRQCNRRKGGKPQSEAAGNVWS